MSNIKSSITAAFVALLNVATSTSPRYVLTDERIEVLSKIHGSEKAFLRLTQNFYGAPTERVKNAVEFAIRKWVPEELEAKWSERDARADMPMVNGVRYASRSKRAAFNPIRIQSV